MSHTVLIVDDEPTQRRLIEYVITEKLGYQAVTLSSGQEAIDYILSGRKPEIDIVLLDLNMPKVGGMEVIRAIRPLRPQLPIIVLTMHGDLEKAVTAVKSGANDFLAKPVPIERLQISIQNILKIGSLNEEVIRLKRHHTGQMVFSDLIGRSSALKQAISLGQRAASSHVAVLLIGEVGVGKQSFARAIHGCSERSGRAFVPVDCANIPEHMMESVFFGHEKGAFPGAIYRTMGKCREAEGGTLYLDGVSTLSADMQGKLLRALQEGEITPIGGRTPVKINIRVIASAETTIEEKVASGAFREDLYQRLALFPLRLPALAERREDIPLLVDHFVQRYASVENRYVRSIAPEVMQFLMDYPWPDNIRQLENAVFRAVVMSEGSELRLSDFKHLTPPTHRLSTRVVETLHKAGVTGMQPAVSEKMEAFSASLPLLRMTDAYGNIRPMEELEAELIGFALRHYDGHISEAARRLGIGRSTLYRKMQDFHLDHPRASAQEG